MEDVTTSIGNVVKFVDAQGVSHSALVSYVHGPNCVNVAYLSADPAKTDSYGRQVERATSVSRKSENTAPGGFYFTD